MKIVSKCEKLFLSIKHRKKHHIIEIYDNCIAANQLVKINWMTYILAEIVIGLSYT